MSTFLKVVDMIDDVERENTKLRGSRLEYPQKTLLNVLHELLTSR
jgi:hypothetical protein